MGATSAVRPRNRRQGSCFFWFLTGGLLGALAVAITWMMDVRASRPAADALASTPRPAQTHLKPHYDYPSILPELKVVVPDREMGDPNRPPALPPPPGAPEAGQAAAKGTAKETAKAAGKEPAKTAPKEPIKAPAKEPTKEPTKEASKAPAKEPTKEASKTPAKGGAKEAGKESAKAPSQAAEAAKEPAKVATPNKPAPAAGKAAAPVKEVETPASGEGETYVLQIASLATPAEAEQFKAKLAAQGISANIQPASIGGKTHYRVRTGTLKGKEAANKTRAQIASKGYQAMTIKLK